MRNQDDCRETGPGSATVSVAPVGVPPAGFRLQTPSFLRNPLGAVAFSQKLAPGEGRTPTPCAPLAFRHSLKQRALEQKETKETKKARESEKSSPKRMFFNRSGTGSPEEELNRRELRERRSLFSVISVCSCQPFRPGRTCDSMARSESAPYLDPLLRRSLSGNPKGIASFSPAIRHSFKQGDLEQKETKATKRDRESEKSSPKIVFFIRSGTGSPAEEMNRRERRSLFSVTSVCSCKLFRPCHTCCSMARSESAPYLHPLLRRSLSGNPKGIASFSPAIRHSFKQGALEQKETKATKRDRESEKSSPKSIFFNRSGTGSPAEELNRRERGERRSLFSVTSVCSCQPFRPCHTCDSMARSESAPYLHPLLRRSLSGNPKGIASFSPGLRGTSYPGSVAPTSSTLKELKQKALQPSQGKDCPNAAGKADLSPAANSAGLSFPLPLMYSHPRPTRDEGVYAL